jgi:hypothetical protein
MLDNVPMKNAENAPYLDHLKMKNKLNTRSEDIAK